MRKRVNIVVLMLMCILIVGLIAGCGSDAKKPTADVTPPAVVPPAEVDIGNFVTLMVRKVDSMPEIDGNPDDPQWKDAIGIATSRTTLKAIYTDEEVAFMYIVPKEQMSIVTPDSWYYDGNKFVRWREYSEGIGEPMKKSYEMYNMAWETSDFNMEEGGCEAMCHEDETGVKHHMVPPGASADLWTLLSKHGYGPTYFYDAGFPLGYLGAYQKGPIGFVKDNPNNPFLVTSGTFNFIGWADERIQTSNKNPDYIGTAKNTETGEYCLQCHGTKFVEDRPLQGKPGKMPYRRNTLGFADMFPTEPEYIKLDPKDYADAMVITDKDIKDGRAVKIASLSKEQIEKAWAKYKELNCLVPELILQEPSGNMAQVLVGAQWSNGVWTVEVKRSRVTGNPHDIQFDNLSKKYAMQSAGLGLPSGMGVRVVFENLKDN